MRKGLRENVWLTHIAVAAGYALAYLVLRPFSDAHWTLTSGLRVACLLLVPYRYWPAMVVGEIFPLTYWNYLCVEESGAAWVFFASVPPLVAGMPLVWCCRSHLGVFPTRRLISVSALLLLFLLSSIVWAFFSYLLLFTITTASKLEIEPITGLGYFFGNYLGMITIVPWALLLREKSRTVHWRNAWKRMVDSTLLRDGLRMTIPALLILAWLSSVTVGDISDTARIAMFLPVAWLTLKHGWRAVMLGGTLAIICISRTLESEPSLTTMQPQALVAIVMTCLYALGSRISVQFQQHAQSRFDVVRVKQVARKSFSLGEWRMQQTSRTLEYFHSFLQAMDANVNSQSDEAEMLRRRIKSLADSIFPSVWRERGIRGALHQTIGKVLKEAGIAYRFEANGSQIDLLTHGVQVALYRASCEAVAFLSSSLTCSGIRVAVRCGEMHGHRWVVLRVDGVMDERSIARSIYHSADREMVTPRLGAQSIEFKDLREFAGLFNGEARIRTVRGQMRIAVLLHDPVRELQDVNEAAKPLPLWVG